MREVDWNSVSGNIGMFIFLSVLCMCITYCSVQSDSNFTEREKAKSCQQEKVIHNE